MLPLLQVYTTVFGERDVNLFINHYLKNTRGHIFTINECQPVYFLYISKSLLLFCLYLKIYSFKCTAIK